MHTHKMITSLELRKMYAAELWATRRGIKGDYKNEYWRGVRFGLESAFWAMQNTKNAEATNESATV